MRMVVQKQDDVSRGRKVLFELLGVIAAMAFCSVFIIGYGQNPLAVYWRMLKIAFGSGRGISNSIIYAIPLMLCGLAVSVAFKMGINNIGAEGQYSIGAFAATGVALYWTFLPAGSLKTVMFIMAFLAGGLWGLISIIPKAFWDVNETIVTLMMNYIAMLFIDYLCFGPWIDREKNLPVSRPIPDYAMMKGMFGTGINAGLLIAIVIAVLIFVYFRISVSGFQIRVIKENMRAARYAGIDIRKKILLIMLVSGGIAGITGFAQVSGVTYRLQTGIANNAGFTAIVIAYLSEFNPFAVLLISVFFGGLSIGGFAIQTMGVPSQIVIMLQGAILLFVLAAESLAKYRIRLVSDRKTAGYFGKEA